MAYCRKCGEVIDDEAVICPKCGVQQAPLNVGKAPNDDGSVLWAVIAFFIPVVGLLLWAAWHDEKPKCARMAAWGTVLSLIVGSIAFFVLFFGFGTFHVHFGYRSRGFPWIGSPPRPWATRFLIFPRPLAGGSSRSPPRGR